VQAQLIALRDSTSNLELAIDTATTAAALTRLLENVRKKEKACRNRGTEARPVPALAEVFDDVVQLVSSRRDEAISNFTHEYGRARRSSNGAYGQFMD